MIEKISDRDRNYIVDLIKKDKKKEARELIGRLLGVKRTQQHYWVNKLSNVDQSFKKTTEQLNKSVDRSVKNEHLEFQDKYVYNKESGKYIFFCKKAGKNIVLEESLLKAILHAYSNFDGDESSLNEISRKFDIPRNIVAEVLSILNFTHDEIPVLKEEYLEKTNEEIVEELIQSRKFSAYQSFQKADWKETQKDAEKWRKFQALQLNPFKDFTENFLYPKYEIDIPSKSVVGNNHLLIALNDIHFGAYADKEDLYLGDDWNIEITQKTIENYASQIEEYILNQTTQFATIKVAILGDILDSLTGFTEKGTPLDTFPIGEKQFDIAFKTLDMFLDSLLKIVPKVEVIGVAGNHAYYGDWALLKCLEKFYSKNKNISFEISKKRWINFVIEDSLFVAEHGYSAFYKARVPDSDKAREAYVKNLLISQPELLVNCKRRYFLTADRHSLEYKEYSGFEFIRFSTPVKGNEYVDHLNLRSASRQNALVINKNGVQSIVNFYL